MTLDWSEYTRQQYNVHAVCWRMKSQNGTWRVRKVAKEFIDADIHLDAMRRQFPNFDWEIIFVEPKYRRKK